MRALAWAAALALGTSLVGCGSGDEKKGVATDSASPSASPTEEETTFDVRGVITLAGANHEKYGGECYGSSGYDDLSGGAQVTIYNGTGEAIALGTLDAGDARGWSECNFTFTIDDVPKSENSTIYSIEVSHRGEVKFTEDEASMLGLTIGS